MNHKITVNHANVGDLLRSLFFVLNCFFTLKSYNLSKSMLSYPSQRIQLMQSSLYIQLLKASGIAFAYSIHVC